MKLVTVVRTKEYQEWEKAVRIALIQKELTVKKLSIELGSSLGAVSSAICGSRPNATIIKRISDYLGISYPGEESAS